MARRKLSEELRCYAETHGPMDFAAQTGYAAKWLARLIKKTAALEAENERLLVDAERYRALDGVMFRCLRHSPDGEWVMCFSTPSFWLHEWREGGLDAYADALRKEQP